MDSPKIHIIKPTRTKKYTIQYSNQTTFPSQISKKPFQNQCSRIELLKDICK